MKFRFSPLFATFAALSLSFAPLAAQAQNAGSLNLSREQRTELRQLREDAETLLETILSESQWEEYQEAREQGIGRNRALRQLDLSEEQRVAVKRLQELFKQERQNIIEGTQTAQSEEQDDLEDNNTNQNDPLLTLLQVAIEQTPNFLNENQRQTYNTVSPFLQLGLNALSNPEVLNPQETPSDSSIIDSTLKFALDQTPNFLNEEQQRYYRAFSPLAELGIDLLTD